MRNFTYYNPTRIVFGRGAIAQVGDLTPCDCSILMVYGQGSIKQNGVYDQVMNALTGRTIIEFSGITPNPEYEDLLPAVELVRRENVGFILAVGGGSVVDAAKFIAAAACFEGSSAWDIVGLQAPVTSAVPVGVVLTLPATASEMNHKAVISRKATRQKKSFGSEHVFPRFAVLDPTVTYGLSTRQTRNGIVDAFVHVIEQYLTFPLNSPLQDRQAEAILATLIEEGPKTLARPDDYDARAGVMWCATQALNGLIGCGVVWDGTAHRIGHELTVYFGLEHAVSVSVVLPAILRVRKEFKADKLYQYGRRIWGLAEGVRDQVIDRAIAETEVFFHSLGMPTSLAAFGVNASEAAGIISDVFAKRGEKLGEHKNIEPEEVAGILLMSA